MKLCCALLLLLPAPLSVVGVIGDCEAPSLFGQRAAYAPQAELDGCPRLVLGSACGALRP
jgi:hypothetical protein